MSATLTAAIASTMTADERLAWEDRHIARYEALGNDRDRALELTIMDWCAVTGEDPDEM